MPYDCTEDYNLRREGVATRRRAPFRCALLAAVIAGACSSVSLAQSKPASSPATTQPGAAGKLVAANLSPELKGRIVDSISIIGNHQVPDAVILNQVRTHEGEPFDPDTVVEDYQRIYSLHKFSDVEAKVEATPHGVRVIFDISEEPQIRTIQVVGNTGVDTLKILQSIDLKEGEAIDRFRVSMAKQAVVNLYKKENFPYAHVEIDLAQAMRDGRVIFRIIEGPNVVVRKVTFVGNNSFTEEKLADQVRTGSWIFVFRSGNFDTDQLDDDVASLRRFYQGKGFFDVRVGRKLIFSPDQTEVQVNFLIEEGVPYTVDRVTFRGNDSIAEAQLRGDLKMTEGVRWDQDLLQRDIRQIVRKYSPLGYIYQPTVDDPQYLQIDPKPVFEREPGKIELVYDIREGKPFKLGGIVVKGNAKTQDKVILRELRVNPGQMYNSGELQDATDRLKGTRYFEGVQITPVGTAPDSRDLLVEVREQSTASLTFGGGVSSNGGVGGNVTYEQRNFDIAAPPRSLDELFSERSFVGAGQTFRATFEPGTEATNAAIHFEEPWVFDQPYSFSGDLYLADRLREHYDDDRYGSRVALGKRFDYVYSAFISLRAENVNISDIEDPEVRAPEINALKGNSVLTSVGLSVRRDTTAGGYIPYRGTRTDLSFEQSGALGGDYTFQRYSAGFKWYQLLDEDLLDRRTVLAFRADAAYIGGDAPFFERLYGGGSGSIRGFAFRGVSPRAGIDNDPIGGNFSLTSTAEISFPLSGEALRGVIFTDVGTVEPDFQVGTIRSSVGFGIRLFLPMFGQVPLALDIALPITKDDLDDTQFFSFSFGVLR